MVVRVGCYPDLNFVGFEVICLFDFVFAGFCCGHLFVLVVLYIILILVFALLVIGVLFSFAVVCF